MSVREAGGSGSGGHGERPERGRAGGGSSKGPRGTGTRLEVRDADQEHLFGVRCVNLLNRGEYLVDGARNDAGVVTGPVHGKCLAGPCL